MSSKNQDTSQQTLFAPSEPKRENTTRTLGPLAHRMRPKTLDEFHGQSRILAENQPLREWILNDRVPSIILWGPPGTGKTTLAHIIAHSTHSIFKSLSAVLSGVKDIKSAIEEAKFRLETQNRKTILFIDEIHRFNKSQQDVLLPHAEQGTIILIGATTENPSFSINAALLSRVRVIRLDPHEKQSILKIITHALESKKGLLGKLKLSDDAIEYLVSLSDGDARQALTYLETLSLNSTHHTLNASEVESILEKAMSRRPLKYDKAGEEHYNVISAFIKSLRDSDPHAGLYYLARMIEAGEDPLFIARRLVIFASEDVGNADPQGLLIAVAAQQATHLIGLPECRINLAQAVTYLALAEKSNSSYLGIDQALEEVRRSGSLPVPFHLRNAPTSLMKQEGYGKGYQYAHSSKDAQVKQSHLPHEIKGKRFYQPKNSGKESTHRDKLNQTNSLFD